MGAAVMSPRTTARSNGDGSVVRYLALAHNERIGASTKATVLPNLGRENRLDRMVCADWSARSTVTSANPSGRPRRPASTPRRRGCG
ncbi:hypothetical protein GCM10023320_82170 [Pseudonocardia adelaidensis]|uniref:Uncharacterized protein n=1 Tax=Pseudonocardia adelaidensis TaxID=648754 RepID=A0ABP9P7R0_9PSEU